MIWQWTAEAEAAAVNKVHPAQPLPVALELELAFAAPQAL